MSVPRLGLDLGSLETKIGLPAKNGASAPRFLSVPTVISYSHPDAEPVRFCCVGERALERRDHLRMLYPLRLCGEERGRVLRDYARKLRDSFQKRSEPAPWGVVSSSVVAGDEQRDARRAVANELFERVAFVDDMFLVAIATTSQEIRQHSVIIDIGHTSIRAALMHGVVPRDEERVEVPFGSERISEAQ